MSLWEYANPVKFLRLSERVLPMLWVLAISSTVVGRAGRIDGDQRMVHDVGGLTDLADPATPR